MCSLDRFFLFLRLRSTETVHVRTSDIESRRSANSSMYHQCQSTLPSIPLVTQWRRTLEWTLRDAEWQQHSNGGWIPNQQCLSRTCREVYLSSVQLASEDGRWSLWSRHRGVHRCWRAVSVVLLIFVKDLNHFVSYRSTFHLEYGSEVSCHRRSRDFRWMSRRRQSQSRDSLVWSVGRTTQCIRYRETSEFNNCIIRTAPSVFLLSMRIDCWIIFHSQYLHRTPLSMVLIAAWRGIVSVKPISLSNFDHLVFLILSLSYRQWISPTLPSFFTGNQVTTEARNSSSISFSMAIIPKRNGRRSPIRLDSEICKRTPPIKWCFARETPSATVRMRQV